MRSSSIISEPIRNAGLLYAFSGFSSLLAKAVLRPPMTLVVDGVPLLSQALPPCVDVLGVERLERILSTTRLRSRSLLRSVMSSVPSSSLRSQRLRAALMMDSSPVT